MKLAETIPHIRNIEPFIAGSFTSQQIGTQYIVFSYNKPIAVFDVEADFWVITDHFYSITTSTHKGKILAALVGKENIIRTEDEIEL